jgi:hypothetical protein
MTKTLISVPLEATSPEPKAPPHDLLQACQLTFLEYICVCVSLHNPLIGCCQETCTVGAKISPCPWEDDNLSNERPQWESAESRTVFALDQTHLKDNEKRPIKN